MMDGRDPVPLEVAELMKRVETMPARWRRELVPLCDRLTDMTGRHDRLVAAAQQLVDDLQRPYLRQQLLERHRWRLRSSPAQPQQ